VLNRRGIQGRLRGEHSHAQRYGDSLAIGMIDIDHFKQVNDISTQSASFDSL